MSSATYQQNSISWQIELLRSRVWQWFELKTSQIDTKDWNFPWFKSQLLWQIVRFFLWAMVAVLLVWVTWQLWLFLRSRLRNWQRQKLRQGKSIKTPPIAKSTVAEWLKRSQEYRLQRDFRNSIFCLYQAMLLTLNDRGIVPSQSSRTDGEYQQALQQLQLSSLAAYELLLSIHQRLCFSNAEANESMFERCQQAYQQIETQ